MGILRNAVITLMNWVFQVTGSYGVAIILITILIKIILYPLSQSQGKAMAKMKEVQPKLKEIQEKYKDDPQEAMKRQNALYKEHQVNPLGGCLPLIVQFPIMIALFQVLREFDFGQATQFLIWNLQEPDRFFILPIIAGISTYLQTALTSPDTANKSFNIILPIFIGWMSTQFPAGLTLYWTVTNILGIGQQWLINKRLTAEALGGEKK